MYYRFTLGVCMHFNVNLKYLEFLYAWVCHWQTDSFTELSYLFSVIVIRHVHRWCFCRMKMIITMKLSLSMSLEFLLFCLWHHPEEWDTSISFTSPHVDFFTAFVLKNDHKYVFSLDILGSRSCCFALSTSCWVMQWIFSLPRSWTFHQKMQVRE